MRTLLVGALAATLIGCSCLLPPQANLQACTDARACFDSALAGPPIAATPASFTAAAPTRTEAASSPHVHDRSHLAAKRTQSTTAATKTEPPSSGPTGETSDPV